MNKEFSKKQHTRKIINYLEKITICNWFDIGYFHSGKMIFLAKISFIRNLAKERFL
jgi:hypothetical protein